ncbi:TetR/AcrR family transcriptional regulator [Companilactobacillus sp. DQM5]|uniref:TetR/AcrR family transcriptional regulator n=1 Tax=Companilactobacillus sp. DQM5 TaxID=3463359 RepID=UPI004059C855
MSNLSKELIMDTAEKLVIQNHSTNIRLEKIASELSVTHAAIYKYFKNRNDLWISVSTRWFHNNILDSIELNSKYDSSIDELHDWLWQFVNAKKESAINQKDMFELHMIYLDNHPEELKKVLLPCYKYINSLLNYQDKNFEQAEAILSCFTIFIQPIFKRSWFKNDFQQRFENIWNLIKLSL